MNSKSKEYILGLQHLFAMFGATVTVPLMTGLNPSVALFTAGIGTLIFHFITGKKVPVFLGSSFAFLLAIAHVVKTYGVGAAQGGIMAAGIVYVLLSFLVKYLGTEKIKSLFPPVVTGPIIVVIGLTLSPSAVAMSSGNWWIAIFVLIVVICVAIFDKGFFKLVPILIGIFSGYILSLILDFAGVTGSAPLVNTQAITNASWINIAAIFRGEFFTLPEFNTASIVLLAPIAIVTFMEHIGDITINGAVVGKNFYEDPGLHRTVLGDGVATLVAGFLGGPANTTYGENTGVLAVTKVYDPKILRLAAGYAIILSLIGKFGAILQTIPTPVIGGVSFVLYGMIASIGIRSMSEANLDFTHSRNLIIVALILVVGLGIGNVPITENFSFSGIFLATLIGIIANKIFPKEM
jgi:uracil permease